jgi:hypothetical protein
MSGSVPKIRVETEQPYTPIKVKNSLNVDGITLTHDDSDDSLSTIEQDDIPPPIQPNKSKSNKTDKDIESKISKSNRSARFAPEDYQNFINSSKTKANKQFDPEDSESDSYSGSGESGSESDYSDSSKSDSSSVSDKKSNKKNKIEEKQTLLLKLYALEKKGVELTKKFSMNSSISELRFEYELHKNATEIEMSVKFQQKLLVAAITGLEFVNKKFDPVGAKLDGWSESIMDNLDDYDTVFTKLHEKYKHRADLPPELQLLVTLAGSAFMFHMTKSLFSSMMPANENPKTADIIKNMSYQNANLNSNSKSNSEEMSGPSAIFSNILKDSDSESSGSIETSKEVTVNQKGKRAINL